MHYVFFESDIASSKIIMGDLEKNKNVSFIYRDNAFRSKIKSKLFQLHMSQKVNRKLNLPFQKIWFKSLMGSEFSRDEEIYFVFIAGWYSRKLLLWLKENYPNSKQILILRDTVEVYKNAIPSFKNDNLSEIFDLILTYNPEDSKKYGYKFSPVYISKIDESKLPKYPKSDVAFIGVAKDRLPIIHSIYKKLSNFGLKCDFYITDVEKEDRLYSDEITYAEAGIPYIDYLGREASADCILEIIKGDTKGNTYRCWEAVFYNKKLLTNWTGIKEFQFYNPKYMQYFESVDDIDLNFFRTDCNVSYNYSNENSPIHLLDIIKSNV